MRNHLLHRSLKTKMENVRTLWARETLRTGRYCWENGFQFSTDTTFVLSQTHFLLAGMPLHVPPAASLGLALSQTLVWPPQDEACASIHLPSLYIGILSFSFFSLIGILSCFCRCKSLLPYIVTQGLALLECQMGTLLSPCLYSRSIPWKEPPCCWTGAIPTQPHENMARGAGHVLKSPDWKARGLSWLKLPGPQVPQQVPARSSTRAQSSVLPSIHCLPGTWASGVESQDWSNFLW